MSQRAVIARPKGYFPQKISMEVTDPAGKFIFEGVKPECLHGRYFSAAVNRKSCTLVVEEFYQRCIYSAISETLCERKNSKLHRIDWCQSYCQSRIIGRPLCIGCRGDRLLFQYITSDCLYIRFFVVDISEGSVRYFEDTQHYFNRDMASVCPLEGIICSDRTTVLIRLPQNVMTSRKWSKLLQTDLIVPQPKMGKNRDGNDGLDGSAGQMAGTMSSFLRDRKFQAIAAEPNKPGRVTTALVDEYCSRCKFNICDVKSRTVILDKIHRLSERCVTLAQDSDSEDDEPDTYFLLHQCTMAFCKSGEILVLCCVVLDNRQMTHLRLFLFRADGLRSAGTHTLQLPLVSLPLLKSEMFSPILSTCDDYVSVYHLKRGLEPTRPVLTVPLPKRPHLKSFCRSVILRYTHVTDLKELPLPKQMVDFLNFRSVLKTFVS